MTVPPPDTRPNSLSDRDIALLERMAALLRPGASVQVADERMSQLQFWALTTAGLLALGMMTWGLGKIVEHGQLMVHVTTTLQELDKRVTRLEDKTP